MRTVTFSGDALPEGYYWFNPPTRYRVGNGLEILPNWGGFQVYFQAIDD